MDDKEYKIIIVGNAGQGNSILFPRTRSTKKLIASPTHDMSDPQVRREVEESFLPDHLRNPPPRKNRSARKKR